MTREDLHKAHLAAKDIRFHEELLAALRAQGLRELAEEAETDLAALRARFAPLEAEAAPIISGIEDDMTRVCMRLHFQGGLSWAEISDLFGGLRSRDAVQSLCMRFIKKTFGRTENE